MKSISGAILIFSILISIFYTDIFNFNESLFFQEDIYRACLLIIATTLNLINKKDLYYRNNELIIYAILFIIIISGYLLNPLSGDAAYRFILGIVLYISFSNAIKNISLTSTVKLLNCILLIQVIVFNIYILSHIISDSQNSAILYSPNRSILGALFGCYLIFLLPTAFKSLTSQHATLAKKLLIIAIIIWSIINLIYLNSKASWFAFICCSMVYFFHLVKSIKQKKQIISFLLLTITAIAPLLYFYKVNSTYGRLLIYKISLGIFKQNWVWGIGNGNFKTQYNLYQAKYFSENGLENKYAFLADNTYFAFNDLLQLFIENGLFLGSGIVIGFALFLKLTISLIKRNGKHSVFIPPFLGIIFLLINSFFSYPLEHLPLAILAILFLAFLSLGIKHDYLILNKSLTGRFLKATQLGISCILIIYFLNFSYYKIQSHDAFELSAMGYKTDSRKIYSKLYNSNILHGATLFQYANEMRDSKNLNQALQIISTSSQLHVNNEVFLLMGSIQSELGNKLEAEKNYKTAISMVPNRMKSRFELLLFYVENKDTVNVIKWANSILTMRIKSKSEKTDAMLLRTERIKMQFSAL